MLGNMVVGAALVPLAVVGCEVGVNIIMFAEGDSVRDFMVGKMVVGAALVPLAVVGWEVGVNIVIFDKGDSVATEEGKLVVAYMGVGAWTGGCWFRSWG